MLRIDKYLADCGLGTRSEVKKYIKAGWITQNGTLVTKPDQKTDENKDLVCFKGEPVVYEKYVYYLLHKPAGCVTAKQDNVHPTVMEYFPDEIKAKDISPVGRLDLDTEGLLLFTNDGPLTHHLLSPSHHVSKTYFAVLDKKIPDSATEDFLKGVNIGEDKPTLPAELEILPVYTAQKEEHLVLAEGDTVYSARLTIHEGRYHQVKRMFEAVGCSVIYLKRLSMGSLLLADLPKGQYRKLTEEEIAVLCNH